VWNPERVPLEVWIKNHIRSEMSNLVRRKSVQSEFSSSDYPDETRQDAIEYQQVDNGIFKHQEDNPELACPR
jgi:hypothetical protein